MKRRKCVSSRSSNPSTSRRSDENCSERLSLSRILMTASSPWTDGMIETRKSIERPPSRTRKRPSWGTRFSAIIQLRHHLDAADDRRVVLFCDRLHGLLENAVDAVLDDHFLVPCLDVNVRGASVERVEDRGVQEADDRGLVRLDLVDRKVFVPARLILSDELQLEGLGTPAPGRAGCPGRASALLEWRWPPPRQAGSMFPGSRPARRPRGGRPGPP